jgi:hypothetical protein
LLCDVARALVKDTGIYIKTGDVEVRVGWDEEVFTQTDGAKLEASASVWRGRKFINLF